MDSNKKFPLADIATIWTYYIQPSGTNYNQVTNEINSWDPKGLGTSTEDARNTLMSLLPQFEHIFKRVCGVTGSRIYDDLFLVYGTKDPKALVPIIPFPLTTSWENLRMIKW